jgi:hypothetical protein
MGFAALCVVVIAAFGPQQANRLSDLRDRLGAQERIRDDLHDVVEAPTVNDDCDRIAIPSTQAVPLLALWLDLRPSAISLDPVAPTPSGYLIEPVNSEVADLFRLDPHDPHSRFTPPLRIATTAANGSWLLFGRCGAAAQNPLTRG